MVSERTVNKIIATALNWTGLDKLISPVMYAEPPIGQWCARKENCGKKAGAGDFQVTLLLCANRSPAINCY